jgi:hypothetical protein
LDPLGISVGFVVVESTVTATVPEGAVVPEAGATVTVKVTSVPLALYTGLAGDGLLMPVVVPTAVPNSVPVSVRLPMVDAWGR